MTTLYAPESRERRVAGIQLATNSVQIRPDAPFTYRSKKKGPIYCDNRRLLSFPEERMEIIRGYLNIMRLLENRLPPAKAWGSLPPIF